jgi:beta-lactamase class A
MNLSAAVDSRKFAVSLVDVTDAANPRYAGINDTEMMYAASLPKIAILLAGFEQVRAGTLAYTPQVREMFTRIARVSSNVDASRAVQMIGFDSIAQTLTSAKYRLYDPIMNGGLWVGKLRRHQRRWGAIRCFHRATTLQTARFFRCSGAACERRVGAVEEILQPASA